MISYCWAQKEISKPIFERLKGKGYRVWFDEENMHGNSVAAMADAIENSECIIICMSTEYRRSNACHHEADYAYILKRTIIPIRAEPKYKPESWLAFIIGSSIYVDFTKHEFDKAFDMLELEIKHIQMNVDDQTSKLPLNGVLKSKTPAPIVSTAYEDKLVDDWTSDDILNWCRAHELTTFEQLFKHYDGACLIRLHKLSKDNGDDATFRSLQDDCQPISSNDQKKLTLTEFIRFQTALDKRIKKDTIQSISTSAPLPKSARTCSLF